ncbi:MAG: serine protease [Azospirillaceae bacterium]
MVSRTGWRFASPALAAVLAAGILAGCTDVRPIRTQTLEPIPVPRTTPSALFSLTSPILAQPLWESTGYSIEGPNPIDLGDWLDLGDVGILGFDLEFWRVCDGSGTETILGHMSEEAFKWFEWEAAFADALKPAGYDILDPRDSRFANEERAKAVRYRVEPRIDAIDNLWCYQEEIAAFQPLRGTLPRGIGSIAVRWTVFDELSQRIVLQSETRGFTVLRRAYRSMQHQIIHSAFISAARNLGAQPAFHRLAVGGGLPTRIIGRPPPVRDGTGEDPPDGRPMRLVGAPPPRTGPAPDSLGPARRSVAVVHAGGGHGSAFLITPDGLMLTNEHVVGAARQVRVEFEDGTARVARVLDRDRPRDVALLDIGPVDRPALPIRLDAARVGERVAAIGAGLRDDLPASVTEGVVSAWRESDWRPDRQIYIQSDADIIGGNSGGPLVDRRGNVVGIAVAGFVARDGEDTSLDLFVPIGEALEVLGLALPHGVPEPSPRPGRDMARREG